MRKGIFAAFLAYGMWGLLPLYWRLLGDVAAFETLSHRIIWSFIFLLGLLALQKDWRWLREVLADRQATLRFIGAAILLSINWGVFIWSINNGFVVEVSLGYFINPLVNVLLGRLFFNDKLRPLQLAAIIGAGLGVLYLTFDYGRPPYISLILAFSFAFYGLLKKKTTLKSDQGLWLETAVMLVPALIFLGGLQMEGIAVFRLSDMPMALLLIGSGVVTALPLMLFAYAARRVTLTTMGLMQYLAPTGQFLLGVFVFREPFERSLLVGYGLIWMALVVYSAETLFRTVRR